MSEKLTGYPSIDKPWRKYYSEEELSIQVPEMSLTDYLHSKNKNNMHLPALRYYGKRVSYKELFENIDNVAQSFYNIGVREGDYVALAMPLTPEVIYMIYALDRLGASANIIDPRVPITRMNYYLKLSNIKIGVVIAPYAQTMIGAARESSVDKVIIVSPFESFSASERRALLKDKIAPRGKARREMIRKSIIQDFEIRALKISRNKTFEIERYSKFTKNRVPYKEAVYDKQRTAIVEYTSGTTGIPKGLELTSSGMNVTAEQISVINHSTPGESILSIMPPFISYGAVTGMHMSLASGMEMVLIPNFTVDGFASNIKEEKPNNIICVPSMFERVIESDLLEKENLSYLKRVIFGGGTELRLILKKELTGGLLHIMHLLLLSKEVGWPSIRLVHLKLRSRAQRNLVYMEFRYRLLMQRL